MKCVSFGTLGKFFYSSFMKKNSSYPKKVFMQIKYNVFVFCFEKNYFNFSMLEVFYVFHCIGSKSFKYLMLFSNHFKLFLIIHHFIVHNFFADR